MKPKGYLIFHLNLGFSAIEEESWLDVINTCYHPLLEIIEKTGIPIGIELTGWTLLQIEKLDKSWVDRLKKLIEKEKCELIGSGYCQIIGPIVPYIANDWNQRLALETYKKILDCRPEIILVNEMAYSNSLVDLYHKFGYKGFIMDRDNVRLALGLDKLSMSEIPTHARGASEKILPILWSDSILFQKVQHYAHGDMSIADYLEYINNRIEENEKIFPIYCNDAEVFDFRPGRFSEERPTHHEGEWLRINKLINSLTTEIGFEWISPSQALLLNTETTKSNISSLSSIAHPIPVKKQAKYNIARWSLTGRDDLWLNTMCHRIVEHLVESKNNSIQDWAYLCEFWMSDLRTHITEKKWLKNISKINTFLINNNINSTFDSYPRFTEKFESLDNVIGRFGDANIKLDKDDIFLSISTKNTLLVLNLRRGLAIQKLAYASHEMQPCVGTLPHGHFSNITLGSDFYSGGVVIELPSKRTRITDLERVEPSFLLKNNGDIEVHAEIRTSLGKIIKKITISSTQESISLSYIFPNWEKILGSVRLGTLTFLDNFSKGSSIVKTFNGGLSEESFSIQGEVSHVSPSSTLVSSSNGFGATTGEFSLNSKIGNIYLSWNPALCAVMPMMQRIYSQPSSLFRLFFSMQEIDDTKKASKLGSFSYSISSYKKS